MPVLLTPYLTLDGTAREAMTLYQSVFGGELSVMTFGDMGAEGDLAAKVMHAHLATPDGLTLMASDIPPGEVVEPGSTVRVSLSGTRAQSSTRRRSPSGCGRHKRLSTHCRQ